MASEHPKCIDVLITCALPASGKSETRKFLANLSDEDVHKLHLGKTDAQVDDYPYVHVSRTIDQCLEAKHMPRIFFDEDTKPYRDPWAWLILIQLVNEDFHDLVIAAKKPEVESGIKWLFDRFHRAASKYPECRIPNLDNPEIIEALIGTEAAVEADTILKEKFEGIPDTLEGRTVVIEFARGGPEGATFPLPAPIGYQSSLAALSDEILERASIMYIWVTPEQSYAKNIARGQEASNTTSTQLSLNHSVPHDVMKGDYGTDDFVYLVEQSDRPGFLKITNEAGHLHYVPTAVFDNRSDLTSGFRQPPSKWDPEEVSRMKAEIDKCFVTLLGSRE